MNFFKLLNFPLKSTEIPVGLRFQLASVTINFTDNRDYRAVLYSMLAPWLGCSCKVRTRACDAPWAGKTGRRKRTVALPDPELRHAAIAIRKVSFSPSLAGIDA